MPQNQPQNRFIEDHRDEILDIAEPALGIVDNTSLKRFCMPFDTTEKEIRQFVVNFINVAIEDESLKAKMLQHFETFQLKKWISNDKPQLLGEVRPIKDKNEHVKKIDRWSYIGQKKLFGRVKTDLGVVRCVLHELFHSVSSKHDIDKIKQHEQMVDQIKAEDKLKAEKRVLPAFETDKSIGEVESIFGEMLFNHIVETRLDDLKMNGKPLFGLPDDEILHRVEELKAEDLREFLGKSNETLDTNNHSDKEYWFRYVRGYELATIIADKYKNDPENTMKNVGILLDNCHKMSPEDVARLFYTNSLEKGEGGTSYHQQAKNNFKEILSQKFSAYSIGPQIQTVHEQALREEIKIKQENKQREIQTDMQKSAEDIQQERQNG